MARRGGEGGGEGERSAKVGRGGEKKQCFPTTMVVAMEQCKSQQDELTLTTIKIQKEDPGDMVNIKPIE